MRRAIEKRKIEAQKKKECCESIPSLNRYKLKLVA
jgi:hypothetical protein